jgi:DNA-binding transcriptional LysR family regulator
MLDATRLRVLVAVARSGSVTAAAQALNYAQPSISHHIARLEAETGAKLMERAGRGVRLTDAGRLLAERAEEILGRLDSAEAELAAHVGLRQGRVRLVAFGSALGTIVPAAAAWLQAERPDTDLMLAQAEPADALRMLRAGLADVALTFRYRQDSVDPGTGDLGSGAVPVRPDAEGLRNRLLLDEPVYLVTGHRPAIRSRGRGRGRGQPEVPEPAGDPDQLTRSGTDGRADDSGLVDYADQHWIAGCDSCRGFLLQQCAAAGFTPNIAFTTDDYVAAQALVAAGLGVTMLPGLALRAARHPGITATALPGARRHVLAVTYGDPPDPPASAQLIDALLHAAQFGSQIAAQVSQPTNS